MPSDKRIKLLSVAESPADQEMGLQFVHSLPAMTGMLFSFAAPRVLSFWMKNTYVPLDIAFVNKDGVIIKTEQMIPLSLRTVSSGSPCVMALEVPAGTFQKLGGVVGKKLALSEDRDFVFIND